MMPAAILNGRLHTRCETCRAPAQFGEGVSLRRALDCAARGETDRAKENLGQWYCSQHWKG